MKCFWTIFALVATVCAIGQPVAAAAQDPTICSIHVELTETAETQLGGASYSGPKLTPEEIMAGMKKTHQVHHPQYGGAFFIAE